MLDDVPTGFVMVLDLYRGGYSDGFDIGEAYEFWRPGNHYSRPFRLCDTGPLFNVAGLYYRPLSMRLKEKGLGGNNDQG